MIERRRAAVRPRVFVPDGTGVALLEDQVTERIEARRPGIVELTGPAGAGKTTALAHLRTMFGDDPFMVLVEAPVESAMREVAITALAHLVISVSPLVPITAADVEYWALAPWGRDEWIEYLLARHHDRCASVMRRLVNGHHARWLAGRPELCTLALDRLAADEELVDVKEALRQELWARLATAESREAACDFAFRTLLGLEVPDILSLWDSIETDARALLRHDQVQMLLAAEYVAASLMDDRAFEILQLQFPVALMQEVASLVRGDEPCLALLRKIVASRDPTCQPMAASLLHAANVEWKPLPGRSPNLVGAHLPDVRWRGMRLVRLNMSNADLSGADLSESKLKSVNMKAWRLGGARLHGAILKRWLAVDAVLSDADLSHINAPAADLSATDLRDANLDGALLRNARFYNADLRGARFVRADLTGASFAGASVEGADFSGADLWAPTCGRSHCGRLSSRGRDSC